MKHYIDLGAHFGEGYERIKQMVGIDNSWGVYLYEPNPLCYGELLSKGYRAKIFTLAISDEPKITGFTPQLCYDGSAFTREGFGSALTDIGSTEKGLGATPINVMCVPLSTVIDIIAEPIDELHIKIDIEGAEYSLDYSCLPKHCLVYLYIEWHTWGCDNPQQRKRKILDSLPLNVVAKDWD